MPSAKLLPFLSPTTIAVYIIMIRGRISVNYIVNEQVNGSWNCRAAVCQNQRARAESLRNRATKP